MKKTLLAVIMLLPAAAFAQTITGKITPELTLTIIIMMPEDLRYLQLILSEIKK